VWNESEQLGKRPGGKIERAKTAKNMKENRTNEMNQRIKE
jgi:hypothetical protein